MTGKNGGRVVWPWKDTSLLGWYDRPTFQQNIDLITSITCLVTDALPQNGTYLRNGPGLWDVGEHSSDHIFDGYATLVRISFRRGRATGAHRQVESDAYKAAMAHGRPLHREFSQLCRPSKQQPGGSLLDRVGNVVGLGSGALLSDNANISVLPLGDGRVMCLTETTKSSLLIDPETLDTIGKFRYADRLWGLLQTTHPVVTGTKLLTLLPDMIFRRGHRPGATRGK
jgi:carlactone synthase/all-trans-10'-apo-beta-carotenal 13,14-cleaving dioxygenase